MVKDASGNPIKVIRIISYPKNIEGLGDVRHPYLRRLDQFQAYAQTAATGLLDAGTIHTIEDGDKIHTVESLDLCNGNSRTLAEPSPDYLADFTAVAKALKSVHDAGGHVVNLKPDSTRLLNGEAKFVNPSLFCRGEEIFDQFFAGSTPLRYYGEDFLAAFNKEDGADKSAAVANKTDLLAFGVLLFQSLTNSLLYSCGGAGNVFKNMRSFDFTRLPIAGSSRIEEFLKQPNIAGHIKAGCHVKNLFAWAAGDRAIEEIANRIAEQKKKLGYSGEKINKITDLITTLITLKLVDGKYIMARVNGEAPTVDWVLAEMRKINEMS